MKKVSTSFLKGTANCCIMHLWIGKNRSLECHQGRATMVWMFFILLETNYGYLGLHKEHILFWKGMLSLLPFSLKVMGYLFCPVECLTTKVLEDPFSTGLFQFRRGKESLPGGSSTSDREGWPRWWALMPSAFFTSVEFGLFFFFG